MKLLTRLFKIGAFFYIFLSYSLFAQDLKISTGSAVTTDDLARVLDVSHWSLEIQIPSNAKSITFDILQKYRSDASEKLEKKYILNTTAKIQNGKKILSVKILATESRTILIGEDWTSYGKGMQIPIPYFTISPPALIDEGKYRLLFSPFDSFNGYEESNIKSQMELIITINKS